MGMGSGLGLGLGVRGRGRRRQACLIESCMCTGSRIVREWSAIERVMACRIELEI